MPLHRLMGALRFAHPTSGFYWAVGVNLFA